MSLENLTQGGGAGGETASIFVTGLSEADTVSATKDGKTVKGKWGNKSNPAIVVPSGYTQLEYIESTGTQWIDTNYTPVRNDEIEVKNVVCTRISSGNQAIFSAGTSSYQWILLIAGATGEHTASAYYKYFSSSTASEVSELYNLNSAKTVKSGNSGLYYDDINVSSSNYGGAVNTSLRLLARADGSSFATAQIGAVTIRNGNTIHRHLVPAKRNSDGTVGMYDLVNDVFYGNAGSGTFIAGAEIPSTIDGHTIPIKSYGMWTVTATNGTETATQDVLVDAAVEYEIEMFYALWLYREGDECEDITGGWVSQKHNNSYWSSGTMTKNADSILLSAGVKQWIGARPNNTIDVTDYSKLVCIVDSRTGSGTYSWAGTWIMASLSNLDGSKAAYSDITTGQTGELIIDISTVTGIYYIACYAGAETSSSSRLQFSGVYLTN